MTPTQKTEKLYRELRDIIDALPNEDQYYALRDFRTNAMFDAFEKLVREESAAEAKHRRFTGYRYAASKRTAAKILLLNNIADGAKSGKPDAENFLTLRVTAMMAQTVGGIIGIALPSAWIAEVQALNYAKIMNPA